MKTPKDYINLSFRASDLETSLKARAHEQSNNGYSQVIKDDARNYYALLRLCLPSFTEDEWQVLRAALHGWLAMPETVHLLWAEVASVVDDENFVARLWNLSRFECWSLLDAIQRGKES